jgi:hypothetical protein
MRKIEKVNLPKYFPTASIHDNGSFCARKRRKRAPRYSNQCFRRRMIESRQKFSDCQSESRAAPTEGRDVLTMAGKALSNEVWQWYAREKNYESVRVWQSEVSQKFEKSKRYCGQLLDTVLNFS